MPADKKALEHAFNFIRESCNGWDSDVIEGVCENVLVVELFHHLLIIDINRR
jgi:hypothetical protein